VKGKLDYIQIGLLTLTVLIALAVGLDWLYGWSDGWAVPIPLAAPASPSTPEGGPRPESGPGTESPGEGFAQGPALGAVAPQFTLPDLEDRLHSLADWSGRPVLLIFVNPTCKACHDLPDFLPEATRDFAGRVVLISTGSPERNQHFSPLQEGGQAVVLLDPDREVAAGYRVTGAPVAIRLSSDGRVSAKGVAGTAEAVLRLVEPGV